MVPKWFKKILGNADHQFVFGLILFINILVIVMSLWMAFVTGRCPCTYFQEQSLVTLLSLSQLLFASIISFRIHVTRGNGFWPLKWRKSHFLWFIMGLAFLFLACDEIFQIHENIDYGIHEIVDIKETNLTDRLDDAIVGFYIVAGVALLFHYRLEFSYYQRSFGYFILGFILAVFMILFDTISQRSDICKLVISDPNINNDIRCTMKVLEEVFKILAEGVLIFSLLLCYEIARELGVNEERGNFGGEKEVEQVVVKNTYSNLDDEQGRRRQGRG